MTSPPSAPAAVDPYASYYAGHDNTLGTYLEYGDASLQPTAPPLYQDNRSYEHHQVPHHERSYHEMRGPPNHNHWSPPPPSYNASRPHYYDHGGAHHEYSYNEDRGGYFNGENGDNMRYSQHYRNTEKSRYDDGSDHVRHQELRYSDGGYGNRFRRDDEWRRNEEENFSGNRREAGNSMVQHRDGGRSVDVPANGTTCEYNRGGNSTKDSGYEGESGNGKPENDTANGREEEGYDGYEEEGYYGYGEGYESLPVSFGGKRSQSSGDMGRGKRKKGKRGDGENNTTSKYFLQRYKLFSKYDQGILMDKVSWYSVTPEIIGAHIAKRFRKNLPDNPVIVDAFCGAAGNTIQFCIGKGGLTIAIELIASRLKIAIHNCNVYKVASKCEFICGNAYHVLPKLKANPVDAIFLSPPWGGPEYLNADSYDLSIFVDIVNIAKKITNNVAILVPRNIDTQQAVQLFGRCEVEANYIGDSRKISPKTVTIYFGDLVDNVTTEEADSTWVELWEENYTGTSIGKSNEDEKGQPEIEADGDTEKPKHAAVVAPENGGAGERAIGDEDELKSRPGNGPASKDGIEEAAADEDKDGPSAGNVLKSTEAEEGSIVLNPNNEKKEDGDIGNAPELKANGIQEGDNDIILNSSKAEDLHRKERGISITIENEGESKASDGKRNVASLSQVEEEGENGERNELGDAGAIKEDGRGREGNSAKDVNRKGDVVNSFPSTQIIN